MKKIKNILWFSLLALVFLPGCMRQYTGPINKHVKKIKQRIPEFSPRDKNNDGSIIVGLSFSGGGVRATAFSYGVLRELEKIKPKNVKNSILDDVRIIGGASGGAIMAAYLAYKGKDYHDLKERFLFRNAEESLNLSLFSPVSIIRLFSGGINDLNTFGKWMNHNLFNEATFQSLEHKNAPYLWITATDVNNATPFLFTHDTFDALCSDLDQLPIAYAVAASAAFPVVFSPVTISTTNQKQKCNYVKPNWIKNALTNREAPLTLQAHANAFNSYQNGTFKYIKLLDGGITDNIGISGLLLHRFASSNPYEPLFLQEVINLRSFLYIIVDSGKTDKTRIGDVIQGDLLIRDVLETTKNASVIASERNEFDQLVLQMKEWEKSLIDFRCSLPLETVKKYKPEINHWNCKDLTVNVERLSFSDLAPKVRDQLNMIPTRLQLKPQDINLLIHSGEEVVRKNKKIKKIIENNRKHDSSNR